MLLVSPEKLLCSSEVDQVDTPGVEGDFGVLANHAPIVEMLRPGVLTIHTGSGEQKIVVLGGRRIFVEQYDIVADAAGPLHLTGTAIHDFAKAYSQRFIFLGEAR